jgi:ABC-2 type transport system ATP-binding protein
VVKILSKTLSKDHSLVARIIGKEDDVMGVLNSVKDVKSVECLGELESGSRDYHIIPEDDADIRADVTKRLAERQKVILSLRSNELTLEQIFLRLTGEDDMQSYFEKAEITEEVIEEIKEEINEENMEGEEE